MTLGMAVRPFLDEYDQATSAMPERDLLGAPEARSRPEADARTRRGDGPPLTEANLFAAYSIGVQEGPR